jgi:carboxyl-terminal processing protease
LILDLRDNGGGFLDKAIELADHFLDDKKLIVYTEGMRSPKTESFATAQGIFQQGNIVILIDEGSASASEIVAGAVQDWDRGIIIGRRSFGKGLVQKPFYLPDGSMMRLTVAKYYTPTGRAIQKPYNEGVDKYEAELLKRYKHGEMLNKDSISFPDSLKYFTLTNKRVVFGGGGIMPDIFVPIDTTQVTPYYSKMLRQGILNSFVLEYVDKNRKFLKSTYSDFKKFNEKFEVNDKILNELVTYGLDSKIEPTADEIDKSKKDFALVIKALIARDLWEMSEYFQIVNVRDKGFNTAIEVIKNWDKYHSEVLIKQ